MTRTAGVFFLLMAATFLSPALAQEPEGSPDIGKALLVTGKLSGACGIMRLQVQFQENSDLDGGTHFLTRFWATEAARLGMNLEEYAVECGNAIGSYQEFVKMLDSVE